MNQPVKKREIKFANKLIDDDFLRRWWKAQIEKANKAVTK